MLTRAGFLIEDGDSSHLRSRLSCISGATRNGVAPVRQQTYGGEKRSALAGCAST